MKCFKCEKDVPCAYMGISEGIEIPEGWYTPSGGVEFEGGWNFGSSLYDAASDGIHVELVICDDCLKAAQGSDRMREMRKVTPPTKSVPVEKFS